MPYSYTNYLEPAAHAGGTGWGTHNWSLFKNPDGTICPGGDFCDGSCRFFMSHHQHEALDNLCRRYDVPFDPLHYAHTFDLPEGYLAGWIGGLDCYLKTLYVGVSLNGEVSS